mgnify:CR=1 FL=1|jgi:hypothetical protein
MANGADGSIIIDTGLDNTGFERGSQRMQQAIRGVTQAINQSGQMVCSRFFLPVSRQEARLTPPRKVLKR